MTAIHFTKKLQSKFILIFPRFLLFSVLCSLFFVRVVHAASASFSTTGGGRVNTGQTVYVSVAVSGSQAYNAVTVNVNFNNLTYVGTSVTSGWTAISGPSRSGNTVSFSGAMLGSTVTGSRSLLRLTFRAPGSPGTATVSSSGTIALADGSGTQVSGGGNTTSFIIVTPPPPPTPTPTPKPAPSAVNVNSSTHLSSEKWYKARNATLTWNKQEGVSDFSYEVSNKADTTPDDTSEGADTTKTFIDLPEGTSYFHIKAKNSVGWSSATHFAINIDRSAPEPFTITKVKNESSGDYIAYFATNDSISGIEKYTVKTNSQDIGEQKSKLVISKDIATITVTAYDKAGNTTESTLQLKELSPSTTKTPVPTLSSTSIPSPGIIKENNTDPRKSTQTLLDKIMPWIPLALITIYGGVITVLFYRKSKGKLGVESKE